MVKQGCTTVTVLTSPDKTSVLSAAAQSYNQSNRYVSGTCYGIRIETMASTQVQTSLLNGWDDPSTEPDVWTPEATSWLTLYRAQAGNGAVVSASAQSLATTAVVVGMPQPMAAALGWPNTPIGWADLAAVAATGWSGKGHPEWGAFTFGKPNPNTSSEGLAATVASLAAGAGTVALTSSAISNPNTQVVTEVLENTVVTYADASSTYLPNLREAADTGTPLGYLSATVTTEKQLLDYDRGDIGDGSNHAAASPPLVAVYPKEGTFYDDEPYAVLNASWSSALRERGAQDFFDYLMQADQQQRFTDAGFRDAQKNPGTAITASPDVTAAGAPVSLPNQDASILNAVLTTWATMRKPVRGLLMVDNSAAMQNGVGTGGQPAIELVKSSLATTFSNMNSNDQVGLWGFTSGLGSPYQQLVPVGSWGVDASQVRYNLSTMKGQNATSLTQALMAALSQMGTDADSGRINLIVLIAGSNDITNVDSVLNAIPASVHVVTIAYGSSADVSSLQAIAARSRGAFYNASSSSTITSVIPQAMAAF